MTCKAKVFIYFQNITHISVIFFQKCMSFVQLLEIKRFSNNGIKNYKYLLLT